MGYALTMFSGKRLDIIFLSMRYVLRVRKKFMGIFLSIALGIAGLILLVTIGSAVRQAMNDDLELLGGATVIRCHYDRMHSADDRLQKPVEFTEQTLEAVRQLPGVYAASLLTFSAGYTTYQQNEVSDYTLLGIDQYYWDVTTVDAVRGEFFGQKAVQQRQPICVLGTLLAQRIFGTDDVVGQRIQIRESLYEIVGILGGRSAEDRKECAYIPYTTIKDRVTELAPPKLYVRSKTWDDVASVAENIPKAIASVQTTEGLVVDVAWGPLRHLQRMVFWVQAFIVFSVLTSIFLGGFGIWNGMMSSVKSRTREIGLKKAMGATDFDILLQFLVEALTVTALATVLGVVLGRVAVELFCYLLDTRPDEALFITSSVLGAAFSLFVGFVAGYFPARQASRMEVVSAIRYE